MSFSIYQLKPRFQQLLQPVLMRLKHLGITPNQITWLALCISLTYGALLAWQPHDWRWWVGLPCVMLLRMALNAIDGMLANFTHQKSHWGAMLNEMSDQISDAALVLPFAMVPGLNTPLLVVISVAALWVEFAGLLALLIGCPRRFDGPMGKSDRAFAFSVLALLVAFGAPMAWANAMLWLVLALLALTLFNRLRSALKTAAQNTPPTL
jgi:CDP-diacylglycerol---glycerol-3-phosphate 3-phosphatidyltransferase